MNDAGRQQRADEARSDRWVAREVLWHESKLPRLRKCGRVAVSDFVGVHKRDQVVGYSGLATCGSVWACPVCSARIFAERRMELGVIMAGASQRGSVAFATYTIAHNKSQKLAYLWKALGYGLGRVRQDKRVRKLRKQMGFYGYVRVIEVTHSSANGWHPHAHLLYLFDRQVSEEELKELGDAEFAAWSSAAKHQGLKVPAKFCQKLEMVEGGISGVKALSEYMAKAVYSAEDTPAVKGQKQSKISYEMTGSVSKKGRHGSRTPWQVLESFRTTGDMDDLDLWHEYEKTSKGKRAIVFSRGLKNMFAIDDATDEEIAEREVEGDKLFVITDWTPVTLNAWLGAALLRAIRSGGFAAGMAFCAEHGIPTQVMPDCIGGGADIVEETVSQRPGNTQCNEPGETPQCLQGVEPSGFTLSSTATVTDSVPSIQVEDRMRC